MYNSCYKYFPAYLDKWNTHDASIVSDFSPQIDIKILHYGYTLDGTYLSTNWLLVLNLKVHFQMLHYATLCQFKMWLSILSEWQEIHDAKYFVWFQPSKMTGHT